jgi:hypothetical protein
MKLENQVCSLELAKKLKTLGVKQESYFIWAKRVDGTYIVYDHPRFGSMFADEGSFSAFTVAELGSLLEKAKERDLLSAYGHIFAVGTSVVTPRGLQMCMADPNMGAKMLCYLLENKLKVS